MEARVAKENHRKKLAGDITSKA